MRSLAEAACELPWLAPCAGSLVALTRPASSRPWSALRSDPGLVLLLLRQAPPAAVASSCSFYPSLLHEPAVLQMALECLTADDTAFVDWHNPALAPIYRAALSYAAAAEAIALRCDCADSEHAWVGGLLASLGWMVAAVDVDRVRQCLPAGSTPSSPRDAMEHLRKRQQECWGLDQAALARRLAVAWRLPAWLTALAGHLGMPLEVALALGADPGRFQVVQLAVTLVDQAGHGLHLPVGATRDELARALDLSGADLQELIGGIVEAAPRMAAPRDWKAPGTVPLLTDVLRLAAENRKLIGMPVQQRLHADLDALHEATRRQHAAEESRLQERKLSALAELAAGAGHEINNPLAVISGQAQYLLIREQETARRKALQTIVGQTQRIHQTLTQLMQFARPSTPHKQRLDLGGLLREVVGSLQQLADDRQVCVTCHEPDGAVTLLVDPAQMRTAFTALLQNAIEAAPAAGWATVRMAIRPGAGLTVIFEDSGPGLSSVDCEHLFDPFYSGRKAGRGRGLGLPSAWQLARQHGGAVVFEPQPAGPTRFVLTLPPEAMADALPPLPESNGHNGCHTPLVPTANGHAELVRSATS